MLERIGLPRLHTIIYGTAHIGLLFVSPPERSDFAPTCCTGSLRSSVNETAIRYEKYPDTQAIQYSVTGA